MKDIKIDCSDVFVETLELNTSDMSDLENSEIVKNGEIYSLFEKNEYIQHVNGNNSVYILIVIQVLSIIKSKFV